MNIGTTRSLVTIVALAGALLLSAGCARYYDYRGSARPASSAPAGPQASPVRAEPPAAHAEAPSGGGFVATPPPGAQQIPIPASGMHTVVRGNTVYSISRLYGVPVRTIIEANGLKPPYLLKVGDTLQIAAPRTHRVAPGDTVYSISRRYGIPMSELTRANGIASPYTISVGQTLVVPAAPEQPTEVARKRPEPETESAPQPIPKQATPQQIAALPNPPARSGQLFAWPVSGKVISGFGSQAGGRHNDGINIRAKRGATVVAAEGGVVAYAGNELRGFGNLLLIKHADGFMTAYAHNEALLVKRGQKVEKGQAIARVGSSGSVAEPQLHFEIRKGRKAVDPLRYLPKEGGGS